MHGRGFREAIAPIGPSALLGHRYTVTDFHNRQCAKRRAGGSISASCCRD
jgi:hypothetical protein